MKKQVFYIHGGESFLDYTNFLLRLNTKEIWDLPTTKQYIKWTKKLSTGLGNEYEVFLPQMPNAQNAKYEEWKIWFERHFEHLHDGVIFVGCSLGGMFLLKYFSENNVPFEVKALIFMAAAIKGLGRKEEDCGDFLCTADDIHILNNKADKIIVMHSKDDFLVPYEHGQKIHAAITGSQFISFEDKNHFLIEDFPELTEVIQKMG